MATPICEHSRKQRTRDMNAQHAPCAVRSFDKAFMAHGAAGGRLAATELYQAVLELFQAEEQRIEVICMVFWSVACRLQCSGSRLRCPPLSTGTRTGWNATCDLRIPTIILQVSFTTLCEASTLLLAALSVRLTPVQRVNRPTERCSDTWRASSLCSTRSCWEVLTMELHMFVTSRVYRQDYGPKFISYKRRLSWHPSSPRIICQRTASTGSLTVAIPTMDCATACMIGQLSTRRAWTSSQASRPR